MQFGSFLGNERLKERLSASFDKGKTSQCYLITGPVGSGKHTLARLLSAALECESDVQPCLHCGPCRKVLSAQHPDVITVDDPEKRNIPVELIRTMNAEASIRPNEGRHKIFLLPRAHDMLAPAQNALLKLMEEPPPYCVFLFLSENPAVLLPTVRSRCEELSLSPLPTAVLTAALQARRPDAVNLDAAAAASDGWLGQALAYLDSQTVSAETQAFVAAVSSHDPLALLRVCSGMEKWKRPDAICELTAWRALLIEALEGRFDTVRNPESLQLARSKGKQELLSAVEQLSLAERYLQANVSVSMVMAMLAVRLR